MKLKPRTLYILFHTGYFLGRITCVALGSALSAWLAVSAAKAMGLL